MMTDSISTWNLPYVGDGAPSGDIDQFGRVIKPPTASEVAEWEREAREKGFREGRDEGYRAGHEQGHQEAMDSAQSLIDSRIEMLDKLLHSLEQPFADLDAEVESELRVLLVTLAQQLVRREIRSEPGEIVGVIREAMAQLPSSDREVSIVLHPDDASLIRETLSNHSGKQNWTLVEDSLVSRGGCRIHTDVSKIDATLESRLTALAATLLGGDREGD